MVAVFGGSRWKAIYHVPLPPGPVTGGNRQAHVCMNYQPSHLPSPPLPSPPSLTDTEEREHGGLEYARALKCIFTLSIKDLKCLGVRGTRVDVKPQHSGRFRIQKKIKKLNIYLKTLKTKSIVVTVTYMHAMIFTDVLGVLLIKPIVSGGSMSWS